MLLARPVVAFSTDTEIACPSGRPVGGTATVTLVSDHPAAVPETLTGGFVPCWKITVPGLVPKPLPLRTSVAPSGMVGCERAVSTGEDDGEDDELDVYA